MTAIPAADTDLDDDEVMESLVLRFSPSLLPLQQRWRNNGLSADFLADYATTFFPSGEPGTLQEARQADVKAAVNYIANELLENAMKYADDSDEMPTTISLILKKDRIDFVERNAISQESRDRLTAFIERMEDRDPADLYIEIMEEGGVDGGGTGLGFVTMMTDYGAKVTWSFEDTASGHAVVTTSVRIDVA